MNDLEKRRAERQKLADHAKLMRDGVPAQTLEGPVPSDHPQADPREGLEAEICAAINRYSGENASNTPDFILAEYVTGCLAAFNQAVRQREKWYGRREFV